MLPVSNTGKRLVDKIRYKAIKENKGGKGTRTGGLGFLSMLILLSLLLASSCSRVFQGSSGAKHIATCLLEKVPFYPQKPYQCGQAALAGVLQYWGCAASPDDIAREIYSQSVRGTLTLDMMLYAQKKSFLANQYKGSFEDIKSCMASGYPLILLVDYGFWVYQRNHFLVVIGYHEGGIFANSGKKQHIFIPYKDLLTAWKRTNYWTLLITPQSVDLRVK